MATDRDVVFTRTIADIDALAAAIADGLQAECVQLESRPFAAQLVVARLPGMVVQFVREDVALARRIRVPAGKWLFLVPLTVNESVRWNARHVAANDLFVHAPDSECYAFDPAGTTFALITVSDRSELGALARTALADSLGDCTLVTGNGHAEGLQRRLAQLRAATAITTNAHAIQRGVADALIACLRQAIRCQEDVYVSAHRRHLVRRAEDFFRSHLGERVSAAQLSSAARVSERNLRNAFYDVYATSPMRYLRLWQLHQARRALRSPRHPSASVTDIATSHGFHELGRFAGEYKALFGESPSQTLGYRRMSSPAAR
jgi:AraC-like DNA-binding protein